MIVFSIFIVSFFIRNVSKNNLPRYFDKLQYSTKHNNDNIVAIIDSGYLESPGLEGYVVGEQIYIINNLQVSLCYGD